MKQDSFRDFVLEQMESLPNLRCRRMFGGYGLYVDEQFFGILHTGRLYFRTNDASRSDYLAAGMECFRPSDKVALKHYYEVPASVLESRAELTAWARRAAEVRRPPV